MKQRRGGNLATGVLILTGVAIVVQGLTNQEAPRQPLFANNANCDIALTSTRCVPIEYLFEGASKLELKEMQTYTFGSKIISRYDGENIAIFKEDGDLEIQVNLAENNVVGVEFLDINEVPVQGWVINYKGEILILTPLGSQFEINPDGAENYLSPSF